MAKAISTNESMGMLEKETPKEKKVEKGKEEPKGKHCPECGQLLPAKKA